MMGQSKRLIATLKGKKNKKNPFDLMHYTIINRTNNRNSQQYEFSIPSMVPILTQ
jgi:hypothetical protein